MENLNLIKKACFTGYRPGKFPFSLEKNNTEYKKLITSLTQMLINLINSGCSVFYCGMAEGFDLICAEVVLSLKKKYKSLRLVCVLPFLRHNEAVKFSWKKRYNAIFSTCDEVVYSSDEYNISAFQIRNMYMVDHSDCVITWYDGKKGGTRNTLTYAQKEGKQIINLNNDYATEFINYQNKIELIY